MNRFRGLCLLLTLLLGLPLAAQDARPSASNLSPQDSFQAMILTSKAVRQAIESIQPSLVTIESFGGVSVVQGRIGGIRKQGEGNTTGIIVSPEGHIVTSTFNFIQQPPVITVVTSDGTRHVAKMLGRDDTRKICMLKIDTGQEFPLPEMVPVDQMQVGQWAISLGVGYGDVNPAASVGIISAKNRVGGRAVQTDANISPANYGGPLLDIQGRLLGICVPMNPQSQAVGAGVEWYDSGIGFAIPLADADELLSGLKEGKRVYPAYLGILAMPNPEGQGVWIEQVVQGSPADRAGLAPEDVIVAIDGVDVRDMMQLRKILNRQQAGAQIELTLLTAEETEPKKIRLTLDRPPPPKGTPEPLEVPRIR
ncbi:MAG: S1C family serine protease [Mariniblastus sp.]|nr:S1C family serine protease [Mariniblastus sp.]